MFLSPVFMINSLVYGDCASQRAFAASAPDFVEGLFWTVDDDRAR